MFSAKFNEFHSIELWGMKMGSSLAVGQMDEQKMYKTGEIGMRMHSCGRQKWKAQTPRKMPGMFPRIGDVGYGFRWGGRVPLRHDRKAAAYTSSWTTLSLAIDIYNMSEKDRLRVGQVISYKRWYFKLTNMLFRWVHPSLYEGVSVRRSVGL